MGFAVSYSPHSLMIIELIVLVLLRIVVAPTYLHKRCIMQHGLMNDLLWEPQPEQ